MVEHDLAMVGVAGSNPVFRSRLKAHVGESFFVSKISLNFLNFFPKNYCNEKHLCYNNICSAEVVQW